MFEKSFTRNAAQQINAEKIKSDIKGIKGLNCRQYKHKWDFYNIDKDLYMLEKSNAKKRALNLVKDNLNIKNSSDLKTSMPNVNNVKKHSPIKNTIIPLNTSNLPKISQTNLNTLDQSPTSRSKMSDVSNMNSNNNS